MTIEEAIYRLKNTAWLGSDDDREEAEEAVVMAIKALEDIERWRMWSQTYDNLISRQDAIDSFGDEPEVWNDTEEEWAYRNAWVEHISAIKSLPSADAVSRDDLIKAYEKGLQAQVVDLTESRPTGEWIKTEHCLNDTGCRRWIEIECPFCGERPTYEFLENMNYCPNCGSKMKGGTE